MADKFEQLLQQRSFSKENVRFVSLIRDSGTENAIGRSDSLKSVRIGDPSQPVRNLSQIESAFQSARGETVIMVSHVEGNSFVIRDPAQNQILSVPIESVRDLAKKYNIELIDLGCETARQLRENTLGLGVTTTFNTVVAVNSLERALSNSSNYADFFRNLTAENLKVVVDEGFVRGWPLCADVYTKGSVPSVWVKLARIFVSFRQPTPQSDKFLSWQNLPSQQDIMRSGSR